jgi:cytochrome P450
MVSYTQAALDQWRPGQTLNISHEMQMLTLRVASKTLFGLDATGQAEGVGRLIRQSMDTPFYSPKLALFPFDVPGAPFHRALRTTAQLNAALLAMIQRKRANPEQHYDVLATLIQARDEDGGALSDYDLLSHAGTLLIAGHETTANTLAWTLLLLDQHPRVLADLVDELDKTLGGAAPTIEQLRPDSARLPLLDRVIKESMRLLPTAAVGSRVSTGPFALGPYRFPRNTFINYSAFLTHRLPELFDEPQRFRPERWERIDPSPYEYLPFGAGPRMCIGASFAIMELKVVLAMLLQRYRVAVAPGAKIGVNMRMRPLPGMPVHIFAQDRQFRRAPVRGKITELIQLLA